jgi:alkylation response protein AidB-like acyl-CoA dehydrogenase
MDFEFSQEERRFLGEVDKFLKDNYDIKAMDVTRENMAQVCDTPERRAFMKKLAARGWMGITWPKQYGGQDGAGFYEYLLNEKLSSVGAPQIGKGVGIIGKTLINVGSEKLKQEFLPQILAATIEFAVGYSEPSAGSDAAAMRLKAERKDDGWVLNGQKVFTTSAHFADW